MSPFDGKPHILVVEDEPHLAVLIKFNLEREGYRVTTVGDGPAALKLLDAAAPPVDLLILDLMLPGMSGYAVCDSLRQAGNDLPVLMLSARTLAEDRARGFDVGANQYMMKPFDLDELFSRVKNLLKHAARGRAPPDAVPPPTFAFGGAQVNFAAYEVIVGGEAVKLTPLEMKLLQHFIANEGRVIPRRELLEEVWEMPGYVNTRAPDQFIRRLRKIFEVDPAEPRHFLTLRDAGYRFVAEPES